MVGSTLRRSRLGLSHGNGSIGGKLDHSHTIPHFQPPRIPPHHYTLHLNSHPITTDSQQSTSSQPPYISTTTPTKSPAPGPTHPGWQGCSGSPPTKNQTQEVQAPTTTHQTQTPYQIQATSTSATTPTPSPCPTPAQITTAPTPGSTSSHHSHHPPWSLWRHVPSPQTPPSPPLCLSKHQ